MILPIMPNTLIGWYNPRTSHHPASGINDIPIIFIVYIEHDIWWSNHTQLSNQSGFWTSIMGIYTYIYIYLHGYTCCWHLYTPLNTLKILNMMFCGGFKIFAPIPPHLIIPLRRSSSTCPQRFAPASPRSSSIRVDVDIVIWWKLMKSYEIYI